MSLYSKYVKYVLVYFALLLTILFLWMSRETTEKDELEGRQISVADIEVKDGNDIPEIWQKEKPTYLNRSGRWGFQYPEDFVVSDGWAVIVFPKSSLADPESNIMDGLVMAFHLHSYTDDFSLDFTDDTGEVFEYSIWNGSEYEKFKANIFKNDYTGDFALQGEIDSRFMGESYQNYYSNGNGLKQIFTISFQDMSQLNIANEILKSFVSNKYYSLDLGDESYKRSEFPHQLPEIPDSWRYFDEKRISYTFYYPRSLQTVVWPNDYRDGNFQVGVGELSLNDDAEYIGYSRSGALCANTRCYTVGLYALPGSTDLISVAEMSDGSIRAVHYGKEVSLDFSLDSDKKSQLDTYIKIIQSIKVLPSYTN